MRWAPDARGRLERAAFELFAEHGYSAVTVPQIAARAGLTTRTFFRYFADKREVIFGGDEIPEEAARLVREAPAGLDPMAVVRLVLDRVAAERFEGRRDDTAVWRRMIHADDSLRDRDARKRADLVVAVAAAFVDRGESDLSATVYAEAGALVFQVALDTWATGGASQTMTGTIAEVAGLLDVRGALAPGALRGTSTP
jgi:AcrR family transcriptional regulator